MPNETLSMDMIRDAIRSLPPGISDGAAAHFWEYVPQDQNYDRSVELSYIIAAMPDVEKYPSGEIASRLAAETMARKQVCRPVARGYRFALPNLAKRALSEDHTLCWAAMDAVARRKPVPGEIKENKAWLLQLTVACSIGVVSGNGLAPMECSRQLEPLLHGRALMERLEQLIRYESNHPLN